MNTQNTDLKIRSQEIMDKSDEIQCRLEDKIRNMKKLIETCKSLKSHRSKLVKEDYRPQPVNDTELHDLDREHIYGTTIVHSILHELKFKAYTSSGRQHIEQGEGLAEIYDDADSLFKEHTLCGESRYSNRPYFQRTYTQEQYADLLTIYVTGLHQIIEQHEQDIQSYDKKKQFTRLDSYTNWLATARMRLNEAEEYIAELQATPYHASQDPIKPKFVAKSLFESEWEQKKEDLWGKN